MKQLTNLMENYFNSLNPTPVKVVKDTAPSLVPMTRWVMVDKRMLRKRFLFQTLDQRNAFLNQLLQYEALKQHNADISVKECSVELSLCTKNLGRVTELDKEYAKEADILYKDVCYVPEYEPKLAY